MGGLASAVVLVFLAATRVPVVDLAEGNTRIDYIAVSNSAMGLILSSPARMTAGVAVAGPEAALLVLAGLGLAGVAVSRSLPEVSTPRP